MKQREIEEMGQEQGRNQWKWRNEQGRREGEKNKKNVKSSYCMRGTGEGNRNPCYEKDRKGGWRIEGWKSGKVLSLLSLAPASGCPDRGPVCRAWWETEDEKHIWQQPSAQLKYQPPLAQPSGSVCVPGRRGTLKWQRVPTQQTPGCSLPWHTSRGHFVFDSELLQTASALGGGGSGVRERVRNSRGEATDHALAAGHGASKPGGLYPGGVHRWGHGRGAGGRGDVSDDTEGLSQGGVFAEHFLPVLPLLWWLIHQGCTISQCVELSQELTANELFHLQRESQTAVMSPNGVPRESSLLCTLICLLTLLIMRCMTVLGIKSLMVL